MMLNPISINPNYANVILNLSNRFTDYGIRHTVNVNWDGLQIRFPWTNGDIICHSGSYGHDAGMVESYCFPWDEDDVSCLSADKAFDLICNLAAQLEWA